MSDAVNAELIALLKKELRKELLAQIRAELIDEIRQQVKAEVAGALAVRGMDVVRSRAAPFQRRCRRRRRRSARPDFS